MSPSLKGSVTRIADMPDRLSSFEKVDQEARKWGDPLVAEVLLRKWMAEQFELPLGRTYTPLSGDLLVGVLARRAATLEATGSFQAFGPDRMMHCLTCAGRMGHVTLASRLSKAFLPLRYRRGEAVGCGGHQ